MLVTVGYGRLPPRFLPKMDPRIRAFKTLCEKVDAELNDLAKDICMIIGLGDTDRIRNGVTSLAGVIPSKEGLKLAVDNYIQVLLEGNPLQEVWHRVEKFHAKVEPFFENCVTREQLFEEPTAPESPSDAISLIDQLKEWSQTEIFGEAKAPKEGRQTLIDVSNTSKDRIVRDDLLKLIESTEDIVALRGIAAKACTALGDVVYTVSVRASDIETNGYPRFPLDQERVETVKDCARKLDKVKDQVKSQGEFIENYIKAIIGDRETLINASQSDEGATNLVVTRRLRNLMSLNPDDTNLNTTEVISSIDSIISRMEETAAPSVTPVAAKKLTKSKTTGKKRAPLSTSATSKPAVDSHVVDDLKRQCESLKSECEQARMNQKKVRDYFISEQDRITEVFKRLLEKHGIEIPGEMNLECPEDVT